MGTEVVRLIQLWMAIRDKDSELGTHTRLTALTTPAQDRSICPKECPVLHAMVVDARAWLPVVRALCIGRQDGPYMAEYRLRAAVRLCDMFIYFDSGGLALDRAVAQQVVDVDTRWAHRTWLRTRSLSLGALACGVYCKHHHRGRIVDASKFTNPKQVW